MLKADVLNWEGEKVSEISLKEEVFAQTLDKSLLHQVVCWQRDRKRRGTHKTKTRSEVRGGGRKPFRQKGTGNARQGSIRSPLLRGGAVSHGPRPRNYDWSCPKKIRKKALCNALSYLFSEKRLVFIESMGSSSGKTKELMIRFKKIGWKKTLLSDKNQEEKFKRASQNLKNFKFISPEGFNVYDLLKFDHAVLTPSVLPDLYKKCGMEE